MKTKKVAASLPLLAGIVLGIASLVIPFLVANHYTFVDGKRYTVDSYLFFFWGKYYTVVGTKMIQSATTMYDFGDFPLIVMMVVIIGIILAIISLFAGRGLVLNVKGREFKLKLDTSPIFLQTISTILIVGSYLYMVEASKFLIDGLLMYNYVAERGPAMDLMLGSGLALVISVIMTAVKFMKDKNKEKNMSQVNVT